MLAETPGEEDWFVDETPQRPVQLSTRLGFSRSEITLEQYGAFVAATGRETDSGCAINDGGGLAMG